MSFKENAIYIILEKSFDIFFQLEIEVCTKPVINMKKGDVANAQGKPCLVVEREENGDWRKGELLEAPEGQTNNNKGQCSSNLCDMLGSLLDIIVHHCILVITAIL